MESYYLNCNITLVRALKENISYGARLEVKEGVFVNRHIQVPMCKNEGDKE